MPALNNQSMLAWLMQSIIIAVTSIGLSAMARTTLLKAISVNTTKALKVLLLLAGPKLSHCPLFSRGLADSYLLRA